VQCALEVYTPYRRIACSCNHAVDSRVTKNNRHIYEETYHPMHRRRSTCVAVRLLIYVYACTHKQYDHHVGTNNGARSGHDDHLEYAQQLRLGFC